MKILAIRKGFVTNSSSDNYWFVVLEKNKKSRKEMVEQISNKRGLHYNTVANALELALDRHQLCTVEFWTGHSDFFDIPPYALDLRRLAHASDEMFSDLIMEVIKIIDGCIKKYEEEGGLPSAKLNVSKFSKLVRSPRRIRKKCIMDYVREAYEELLNVAKELDDQTIDRLVKRIVMLSCEGLFRIEKGALSYAFISFLQKVAKKKGMHITITYREVPQGEHPFEELALRGLSLDDEISKMIGIIVAHTIEEGAKGEITLGTSGEHILLLVGNSEGEWGVWYKHILADLQETDSFAIKHFRGTLIPSNEIINFLEKHSLKEALYDEVRRGCEKGDYVAKIVKTLLEIKNHFYLGEQCFPAYEYTSED